MDAKDFFYRFGRALYHIDAIYDEFAKEYDLAPTLLWILYALNDGKTHTQHDICVDWELPKSTVNTIITDLRQKEYVTLSPIPGKRRDMTVLLTDHGKSYADSVLNKIYAKEAGAFASLSNTDLTVLETLEKIADLLKSKEE